MFLRDTGTAALGQTLPIQVRAQSPEVLLPQEVAGVYAPLPDIKH